MATGISSKKGLSGKETHWTSHSVNFSLMWKFKMMVTIFVVVQIITVPVGRTKNFPLHTSNQENKPFLLEIFSLHFCPCRKHFNITCIFTISVNNIQNLLNKKKGIDRDTRLRTRLYILNRNTKVTSYLPHAILNIVTVGYDKEAPYGEEGDNIPCQNQATWSYLNLKCKRKRLVAIIVMWT